jgi:hypothetical protein
MHSVRLERLDEYLVVSSGEMVVAHWVEALAVETYASKNLGDASKS